MPSAARARKADGHYVHEPKRLKKGMSWWWWGGKKKVLIARPRGRSQPNWEVFRQKKKEIYAAESPLYSKGLLCVISQPDMVRAVLCACCVGWVRDHFTDDWTCVLGRTNDKSFPTKTFFFHSSCLTFFVCVLTVTLFFFYLIPSVVLDRKRWLLYIFLNHSSHLTGLYVRIALD